MKCPNCDYISSNYLDQCINCKADLSFEKSPLDIETVPIKLPESPEGVSLPDNFDSKSDDLYIEEPLPKQGGSGKDELGLKRQIETEFDKLYQRLKLDEAKIVESKIHGGHGVVGWGGFYRRALAIFVDIAVLFILSTVLFYSLYVAYTVGLSAHGEILTAGRVLNFVEILLPAWIFLISSYFIVLHGMDGRTVGKWLLGLRVVASGGVSISYYQALTRLLGYPLSALLGIGFLWVLISRENRGLHDLLARTWVIRDVTS